jgi:putative addiction module component (TIGR02574 family)
MGTTVDKIVSEALGLPPQARAFLAEKLIESLDAEGENELSPAWRAEVQRRCREIDQGLVALRDAEDVFIKAYSSLG